MTALAEVRIAPRDLVLRVAAATVGASEVPANTNAGPFVERCQKVTGNTKGQPWCASFVAMVGEAALGPLWPVVKTGGCQPLHDWALGRGVVHEQPTIGDVFLVWHAELGRFAHTGFVLAVRPDGNCHTIEGNTSGAGSREGWMVAQRTRRFRPEDRFVRWTELVHE